VLLASAASGQVTEWPSEHEPPPLPAHEVTFPPYEVRTLANGMQVIAVLHHEQPAVSMRLLVRAGSVQDPAGKVGVASLTAALLDQGTTTKSAEQIADQIDFIGGALGTGSGPDLSFVNAIVMKDSFGVGLDLIADVARNPAFAPEEIDRQKQQTISTLQVNAEDPDYVANVVFDRLVYGFHPYGLPNNGTPATIASITREDLQAYHRRYFVPNNMILAIVGDVTSEEAFAGAERVFARWPRAEVAAAPIIEPPAPARRIVIVDKPDSVQTEIRVGQVAIPRKHPDYMAWDLAVKILGGEGANRLHRVLRSERGLTYGASADTEARKQAGDYVAETDTRTDTTGEVLRLMIDEFAKLPRDRVFERELSDAQAYLSGSFPLTVETPNDIATQVLNVVFYDLPVEEVGTFPRRVRAVTPDDIQRVARLYIRTDRLSIVLVGNASAFIPQLRQVGFTDFEIIPIAELNIMSATLKDERPRAAAGGGGAPVIERRPAAYQAPAAQSAQTDARATDLLKAVVDARGGLDALKRVRTVVADADTVLQMEQGQMSSATKTYVAYPDRFRVDATLGNAQVVQIYNAGMAWVKDPSGVHDVPAAMREEMAASVRRDTIPMLIAAAEGRLTARALPDEMRDGRTFRLLEISGAQLAPVTLYVDPQNLIARQSFSAAGPDGRPVQAEEAFSDYRPVNGVQVPFKAEVSRGGRVILSRLLKNVALNTTLDDMLFARPQ
jgi:zinc protease